MLTNMLTVAQAEQQYPAEVAALVQKMEVRDASELTGEFAYDLFPAFGPGGSISDEDEAAFPAIGPYGDDYGGEQDPPPSVTSQKKTLWYYEPAYDELYGGPNWALWNY